MRKGQFIVMFTLVLAVLIGAMGLCADVAVLYYNWAHQQAAVDSGALAGATFLFDNAPKVPSIAAGCNGSTPEQVGCTYATYNGAKAAEVTAVSPAPDAPTGLSPSAKTIELTALRTDVPIFFLRALGRTTPFTVRNRAIAVADLPVKEIRNGLIPIGMLDPTALTFGDPVTLGVGVAPGNWQFLSIPVGCSGPSCQASAGGASLLNANITNGCVCQIGVGDTLTTQTGIAWGQVSSALATRIPNPGTPPPANLTGNEPELIMVPITSWTGAQGNSPVKILGFAELWLLSASKSGSSIDIQAEFVKYAPSFGIASGGPDYGAYVPPKLIQ